MFFSDQFLEHVLIMISQLFTVPCELLDGKLVVKRYVVKTGKFADIQVQFIKSRRGKRVVSNGSFFRIGKPVYQFSPLLVLTDNRPLSTSFSTIGTNTQKGSSINTAISKRLF